MKAFTAALIVCFDVLWHNLVPHISIRLGIFKFWHTPQSVPSLLFFSLFSIWQFQQAGKQRYEWPRYACITWCHIYRIDWVYLKFWHTPLSVPSLLLFFWISLFFYLRGDSSNRLGIGLGSQCIAMVCQHSLCRQVGSQQNYSSLHSLCRQVGSRQIL